MESVLIADISCRVHCLVHSDQVRLRRERFSVPRVDSGMVILAGEGEFLAVVRLGHPILENIRGSVEDVDVVLVL